MDYQTGRTNTNPNSLQITSFPVRYTRSIDTSGWLKVLLEKDRKLVFLCEYTKVVISSVKNGRTYFLIQEGPHASKLASLKNEYAEKCLISFTRDTGVQLMVKTLGRKMETSLIRKKRIPNQNPTFNQLFAILSFNGKRIHVTLDSDVKYVDYDKTSPYYLSELHSKPLPNGTYNILPPEYPKNQDLTVIYKDTEFGYPRLCYDTAWFPIEYAKNRNSNFIHVGHLSEGCITCYEIQNWNDLYSYLIRNRTANGKYVGEVTIA